MDAFITQNSVHHMIFFGRPSSKTIKAIHVFTLANTDDLITTSEGIRLLPNLII
ncbi:MAG: hypothetical protein HRU49_01005 [Winogradskyella sp.]|uniref:hypothetical protein n=1 Tax=Winogradskyella sp. TaxID=1883156 RepID=UPI0025E7AEB9|nr:hypothetical protein [Winogradskyella sp.]NRB82348.1 hypothetical protein [Winogradskyella sp.]